MFCLPAAIYLSTAKHSARPDVSFDYGFFLSDCCECEGTNGGRSNFFLGTLDRKGRARRSPQDFSRNTPGRTDSRCSCFYFDALPILQGLKK
jgi:hypothetical protein